MHQTCQELIKRQGNKPERKYQELVPEHSSPSSLTLPLPTLDLPESENFSENREESQIAEPLCTSGTTLGNAPDAPNAPVQCKSTRENFGKPAKKYSDQLYL